jgi:hypothetical protein
VPLVPASGAEWKVSIMDIGTRWQGTFRMIPDGLWQHPDLELIDLKVWCALSLHARDRGETSSTNASIAKSADTSIPTLKRSLARLVRAGYIRTEGETSRRTIHLVPDAHAVAYTLRVSAHG